MENTDQKHLLTQILSDRNMRRELARRSHRWFFGIYFSHYITYPSAPFHKDLFDLTENESVRTAVLLSFRGSGKSTLMNMSYPIWSIIGPQRKKFVVLIGQTQRQAKQMLYNIRREIESNRLLQEDFGPINEPEEERGSYSLTLKWYDARITAVSMEQTIRGMRHGPYRPDLIIADDLEDLSLVATEEGRKKTFNWITSEVIPAGDRNTRAIFIGNLLHSDSLLMRLKKMIDEKEMDGLFKAIPLVDGDGKVAWPGKFPAEKEIEDEKRKIGDIRAFLREYMLEIVPEEDQVIRQEWIKRYDKLPEHLKLTRVAVGVDPAVKLGKNNDYTAMISANIYGYGKDTQIYILPNPIRKKMEMPEIIDTIVTLAEAHGHGSEFYIESNGSQEYIVQSLKNIHSWINAKPVKVTGSDKRTRLAAASCPMQRGQIFFPEKGAEILIQQLLRFGAEKHDDLCDAFSLLINETMKKKCTPVPEVWSLDNNERRRSSLVGRQCRGRSDFWHDDD